MLYTNLKHIESAIDYNRVISENKSTVLVCGNMEPLSVQIYHLVESFVKDYKHVTFFDIEYDNPEFIEIRNLASSKKVEIPFVALYRNGILVKVINGYPMKKQLKEVFKTEYGTRPVNTSIISNKH
jgi:thioredoxin 1